MEGKKIVTDPNCVTEEAVYFYTPRYYAFDNFSAFAVEIWGRTFPTVEHAYQWRKYRDDNPEIAEQIFNAKSAYATKKIADANKDGYDESWHDIKELCMEEIIRAKVNQHEKLQALLKETGDKMIAENSPVDYFWGVGEDGTGKNVMGKILMKLRSELQ